MHYLEEHLKEPSLIYLKDERLGRIFREAFNKIGFEKSILIDTMTDLREHLHRYPKSFLVMDYIANETTILLHESKGDCIFDPRKIFIYTEAPSREVMRALSDFKVSLTRFGKLDASSIMNDILAVFDPSHPINSILNDFEKVEIARQESGMAKAIVTLEDLCDVHPQNLRFRLELSAAYIKEKRFDDAEIIIDDLLSIDRNSPKLHHLKYQCQMKSGHIEHALNYLKESVRLNPNHSYHVADLGQMHLEYGKTEKALKYYLHAWKIDKKNQQALMGIASSKLLSGDIDEAIKILKKIPNEKERASAFNLAGVIAVKQKKLDLANSMYKNSKTLVTDPSIMAKVVFNQALAAVQLKLKSQTRTLLRECVSLDPGFEKAKILAKKLSIDIS